MAVVKCKQCGGDVAPNAAACPQCGAARPRGLSTGKVLAIVGVSVGALCFIPCLIGGVVSAFKGGTASSAQANAKPTEAAKPVDIRTLLGEYRDNEVRADTNYKGRIIQTTGLVEDVKRGLMNELYVTVGTGQLLEIPVVQCLFDEAHMQKAASLSKGARVTVRGRVDGLMMNVLVRDCEFVGL
jgi:hypothetical protein